MESAREVFDHDFSGDNRLLKILFVAQIITITLTLICWVALGNRAAIITFVLSILVLIFTFIFVFILFARYYTLPILAKKKQLAKTMAGLKTTLAQIQSKIQNLVALNQAIKDQLQVNIANLEKSSKDRRIQLTNQYNNLADTEKTKYQSALQQAQALFIQKQLLLARILDASIPGIGPKLKERLRDYGISSANDVSWAKIYGIPGLGESKARELINWRQWVESYAQKRIPKSLDQTTDQSIRNEFAAKKAVINGDIERIAPELAEATHQAKTLATKKIAVNVDDIERLQEIEKDLEAKILLINQRLETLRKANFVNYLGGSLAKQIGGKPIQGKLIPGGIAATILLGTLFQSGMAAKSTNAIIIASIPTSTPTITLTLTPTVTLTPLPTFTFTPSLTATTTETPTMTPTFTPSSTSTVTNTPTKTMTPTITLPPIAGGDCIPMVSREVGTVVEVIDGDTIKVNIDGTIYNVRYIGIDAPETAFHQDYYGPQATSKNRGLVEGRKVYLFKDVSEVDTYNRLLRYVVVGNVFVNFEMVNSGYAFASAYPPDNACDARLRNAQLQAKTGLFGLWAPTPAPIVRTYPTLAATQSGNCDPSYPTVCIPPYPPDLDCKQISFRRFKVLPPDPHGFDGDHDGIGCES